MRSRLFAFFVALGAFQPGEVLVLTLVVLALALLWVAHAVWDSRHRDPHDKAVVRAAGVLGLELRLGRGSGESRRREGACRLTRAYRGFLDTDRRRGRPLDSLPSRC